MINTSLEKNKQGKPRRCKETLPLEVFCRIEAMENRTDLSLLAMAAALLRLAPALYRDRRRCGRATVCRTRSERVEVLSQRRQRKQRLWNSRDLVEMPPAPRNACPIALRLLFGLN
jgi:hypothetical protein